MSSKRRQRSLSRRQTSKLCKLEIETHESRRMFSVGGGFTDQGITGTYFSDPSFNAAACVRKDARLDFGRSTQVRPNTEAGIKVALGGIQELQHATGAGTFTLYEYGAKESTAIGLGIGTRLLDMVIKGSSQPSRRYWPLYNASINDIVHELETQRRRKLSR